jgi:hypothetical protein
MEKFSVALPTAFGGIAHLAHLVAYGKNLLVGQFPDVPMGEPPSTHRQREDPRIPYRPSKVPDAAAVLLLRNCFPHRGEAVPSMATVRRGPFPILPEVVPSDKGKNLGAAPAAEHLHLGVEIVSSIAPFGFSANPTDPGCYLWSLTDPDFLPCRKMSGGVEVVSSRVNPPFRGQNQMPIEDTLIPYVIALLPVLGICP